MTILFTDKEFLDIAAQQVPHYHRLDDSDWKDFGHEVMRQTLIKNHRSRWNIDEASDGTLNICRGDHAPQVDCVWEVYKKEDK